MRGTERTPRHPAALPAPPGQQYPPRAGERKTVPNPTVGRDGYPKGTGSTSRSFFGVCRWRCVSRQARLHGTRRTPVGRDDLGAPIPATMTDKAG